MNIIQMIGWCEKQSRILNSVFYFSLNNITVFTITKYLMKADKKSMNQEAKWKSKRIQFLTLSILNPILLTYWYVLNKH